MMRTLAALALLLVSSGATAKLTSEQKKQARAHYDRATGHYNLDEYLDAAAEFKAAYEIARHPAILYNVAQSYRLAQDPKQALVFYRAFLQASPDAPDRAA